MVRPSSAEGHGADIIQMALPADLLYYYTDGAVVRVSPTTLGCSPTPPVMINLPDSYHEDASPMLCLKNLQRWFLQKKEVLVMILLGLKFSPLTTAVL